MHAPLALAGIAPNLPADTLSRTVRVLLLPSYEAEDSDWEYIEPEAMQLGQRLAAWADGRDLPGVDMPGVRGRAVERWRPLLRVATAAGEPWPARCWGWSRWRRPSTPPTPRTSC